MYIIRHGTWRVDKNMGRKRKQIVDNPLIKNLYHILIKDDSYKKNVKKLEENGIPRQLVDGWLNGRRNPQIASLIKVADALNFNINILFKEPAGELTPDHERIIELIKRIKDKKILKLIENVAELEINNRSEPPPDQSDTEGDS